MFAVHYNPVSVTEISNAGVYTRATVNSALFDNTQGPNAAPVAFRSHELNPGSPAGVLSFGYDMNPSRTYRFYMYTEVFIWHVANQGYGEAIVDFTKVVSREWIGLNTIERSVKKPEKGEVITETVLDKAIVIPEAIEEFVGA